MWWENDPGACRYHQWGMSIGSGKGFVHFSFLMGKEVIVHCDTIRNNTFIRLRDPKSLIPYAEYSLPMVVRPDITRDELDKILLLI